MAANALALLDGLPGARSEGAFLPLGRDAFIGASILLGQRRWEVQYRQLDFLRRQFRLISSLLIGLRNFRFLVWLFPIIFGSWHGDHREAMKTEELLGEESRAVLLAKSLEIGRVGLGDLGFQVGHFVARIVVEGLTVLLGGYFEDLPLLVGCEAEHALKPGFLW